MIAGLPPIVLSLIMSAVVLGFVVFLVAYTTLLERKFAARMQSRVGPYRVGPHGLFQPIADGINQSLIQQKRKVKNETSEKRTGGNLMLSISPAQTYARTAQ